MPIDEMQLKEQLQQQSTTRPIGRPIRTLFCLTSMPVGGAETLLVNLVRRFNRDVVEPEIACLKEPGVLGEQLRTELPLHDRLLTSKFDVRVLPKLTRLCRQRKIDAVVTVGAGDKMFWGRLAARLARVPVVCSALHSTGWPDGVGRLNRLLTPLTDAFIAVAPSHGRFMCDFERFPSGKVVVIPNGVDTDRFALSVDRLSVRQHLGIGASTPLVGILAALRPEKNHELFLQVAQQVRRQVPDCEFLVIGDGPRRPALESLARQLGIDNCVHFLGSRSDIPSLLGTLDVLSLTSHNEANPVSILESMSCGTPVVSVDVGSIAESITSGVNGLLCAAGDGQQLARGIIQLLDEPLTRTEMGRRARQHVLRHASLDVMVGGYERLLHSLLVAKNPDLSAQSPTLAR
jgi:glycosyltransferase involved in cell wall biosynthesis